MNEAAFAARVQRIEHGARQNPAFHRLWVGTLAAFGYAALLLMVLGALAVFALLAWGVYEMIVTGHFGFLIKGGFLLLGAGVFAYALLRALWVRFEPPTGIPLERDRFPKLYAVLDDLSHTLSAPKFDAVLLSGDLNAAVAQHPRFGLFGGFRNYLILGMPLMQALSLEQFRAVLAHELGHLRGGHARFATGLFRVGQTWRQALEQVPDEGFGGKLLHGFFGWFAPRFYSHTFVLRRLDEFEADKAAAGAAGKEVIASSLCMLPGLAQLERTHWREVGETLHLESRPPQTVYSGFAQKLGAHAFAPNTLEAALREKTGYSDTHPSLADRLRALGHAPVPPEKPEESAADVLLRGHRTRLLERLNRTWAASSEQGWHQAHLEAKRDFEALEELRAQESRGVQLNRDNLFKKVGLLERFEGHVEAVSALEDLVRRFPFDVPGRFHLGRLLLEEGQLERGRAVFSDLVASNPEMREVTESLLEWAESRQAVEGEEQPKLGRA